jgi:hypothetical protein
MILLSSLALVSSHIGTAIHLLMSAVKLWFSILVLLHLVYIFSRSNWSLI